jgi:hypothetical protein
LVPGTRAHTHDGQRQQPRDRPDIRAQLNRISRSHLSAIADQKIATASDNHPHTSSGVAGQYAASLAALPTNLQDGAPTDALGAICDLDLVELPKAIERPWASEFGRD